MKKTIITLIILSTIHAQAFFKPGDLVRSIYNVDNRELVSSITNNQIQLMSKSVALIYSNNDLIAGQVESVIFGNLLSEKPPVGNNYCSTEKFADHHSYRSACTGFLIGKDLLATAGHCFRGKNDCKSKLISFNVTAENEVEKGFKVVNSNIFKCEKIIAQVSDSTDTLMDYAIVKLDHKPNLPVLKFRTKDSISEEENVFMIGHPLGLPLVWARDASVDDNSNDVYFKTTLNSFHGNSGSPVFNSKTLLVEGIMVRGEGDEIYDEVHKCNRYAVYAGSDKDKGEGVTRIKALAPYIYQGFDNNN